MHSQYFPPYNSKKNIKIEFYLSNYRRKTDIGDLVKKKQILKLN